LEFLMAASTIWMKYFKQSANCLLYSGGIAAFYMRAKPENLFMKRFLSWRTIKTI